MALVNVTGYTIACPGFTLSGLPVLSNNSSLVIMYKNSLVINKLAVIDVYRHLTENTTWFRANWTEERTKILKGNIRQPITVFSTETSRTMHVWSLTILIVGLAFFALNASLAYYIFRRKQVNHLHKSQVT